MSGHGIALRSRPRLPRVALLALAAILASLAVPFATVAASASPAASAVAPAVTGDGSPGDANIKYFGRWTKTTVPYVPNWAGAYLKTRFTGTTVKLKQRGTIEFWASIDGGAFVDFKNVSGTVNLTPTKLASGTHSLVASYRQVAGSYTGDAVFGGLVLDPGAHTVAPAVSGKLIEFVGDSITAGTTTTKLALTDYGWLVGQQLGVEHTQIAQGGACLVQTTACVGLSVRFLNTGAATGSPAWNFATYQANAVVINLGTNDVGQSIHSPQFQAAYTSFLQLVRSKYPNAAIFALETLAKRYTAQTQAAVAARNAAGDARVYFVDTEGWVPANGFSPDGLHPNDLGHQAIAAKLAPIIAAKI
jgi:lysophospholipase L1-like esterase